MTWDLDGLCFDGRHSEGCEMIFSRQEWICVKSRYKSINLCLVNSTGLFFLYVDIYGLLYVAGF